MTLAIAFGILVIIYSVRTLVLVALTPDDDMLTEVTEEAETIDVWGRL